MSRRGGKQEGAGRKPGSKNKLTLARENAMAEAARRIEGVLGEDAFKGDAHALLIAVYKDPQHSVELRLDAAKSAIGYERPKLQAIAHTGDGGGPLGVSIEERRAAREKIESEIDAMMEPFRPISRAGSVG